MCEICIKIFKKSENRGIAQKSRGVGNFFSTGGLGKFCCTGGAEPLGGARKSRGAETPFDSMDCYVDFYIKKHRFIVIRKRYKEEQVNSSNTRVVESIFVPSVNTVNYGRKTIKLSAIP